MFSILTNLTKSAVAVVATPVALVADVLTLPSSAMDGRDAFGKTGQMLDAAGKAITEATK